MRCKRLRGWLVERILHWVVIPLVGRGIQVQRQDEQSSGWGSWLHHAPMCGANHYHHTRPITSACTCGAEREWCAIRPNELREAVHQVQMAAQKFGQCDGQYANPYKRAAQETLAEARRHVDDVILAFVKTVQ